MPGVKLPDLSEFSGNPADTDLHLYLVDEGDLTLDLDGSGYRAYVHKNFVVTDGTNPVQILGGGTLNLGGSGITIGVTPGTSGDMVLTDGEQTLYNKTLAIEPGQVGPIVNIRDTDLYIYDSVEILKVAQLSATNLDNGTHTFALPNNDGQSTLVDDETAQTLLNKTLTGPTIDILDAGALNIQDTRLNIRDTQDQTKFMQLIPGLPNTALTEDLQAFVPQDGAASILVTQDASQTLANKTLTTPTIGSFANAQHDHSDSANGGTVSYNDLVDRPSIYMDRVILRDGIASTTTYEFTVPAGVIGGTMNYEFSPITVSPHAGAFAFDATENTVMLTVPQCANIRYVTSTRKIIIDVLAPMNSVLWEAFYLYA